MLILTILAALVSAWAIWRMHRASAAHRQLRRRIAELRETYAL